ncbi:MAG: Gfo/Idh/MocA family oxidoreductase [Rikenellaceae bacterium]
MIRFGIIGTNFITDNVIAGAKFDPRFCISAIYSRSEERAAQFAEKYGVENRFTSLEQMAKSNLIDAVYIASPNSCHYAQAMLFMQHGKHVLCEKAFASNALQAKEMIEQSRKRGVALMEAMKPTLTPNFLKIKELCNDIGKITKYCSSYCQYSSRYDKYKAGIIENAFKYELSNGATVDIGVYTIYPMVILFGKPSQIKAIGETLTTGVDSTANILFKYEQMDAVVSYSKISDGSLPTQIMGEEGTITAKRINIIPEIEIAYRGDNSRNKTYSLNDINEYFYEIEEFINIIELGERESKINSHTISLWVMEILDEIRTQLGVRTFDS